MLGQKYDVIYFDSGKIYILLPWVGCCEESGHIWYCSNVKKYVLCQFLCTMYVWMYDELIL